MLNRTATSGYLYILTFNGSTFAEQASYAFAATDFAGNDGHLWCNGQYIGVVSKPSATYDARFYLFYAVPDSIFKGAGASSSGTKAIILDAASGAVYEFDQETYTDNGETISVQFVSDKLDGGTNKTKILNRLELIGDYQTTSNNISVQYTDDDYQNFSTARNVDASSRMVLTRLGKFQRRAFKLAHAANTALRLEAVELDVDLVEYGQ
jgi:hypothetical protein